jgi:hypothetical protein
METIALLQKLHAIQRAIENGEIGMLHVLVAEAEGITREIQRHSEEQRRRDSRLNCVLLRSEV